MIHVSTVSRRGNAHPDRNEDYFFIHRTENAIMGGVFDGCSSGNDSWFASRLFALILKNTLAGDKGVVNRERFPYLVKVYLKNLSKTISILSLPTEETLTTAVLFVYELNTSELEVKFFGDGVAYANNRLLITCNHDEDNQPDYLGYSISQLVKSSDFGDFWDKRKSFQLKTNDFTIATDGIFSFKKRNDSLADIDLGQYLAEDRFLYNNPAGLKRKLNLLKNKGYEHDDDVTILRIINETDHEQ